MKTTNLRSVTNFASISLATLSLVLAAPSKVSAVDKAPESNHSKAPENHHLIGVSDETSFFIKKEGVRHFLVACNRGEFCQTVCQPSDPKTFKVTVEDPKQPLKITFGDEKFLYLPFAGGSFSRIK